MGCGHVCPICLDKKYEDCQFDDPAGQHLETGRIRGERDQRVQKLIGELLLDSTSSAD
jgi:arsenate reductase (thioredoxin)